MISTVSRESAPRSTNLESAATCGGFYFFEGEREKERKKVEKRSEPLAVSLEFSRQRETLLALFSCFSFLAAHAFIESLFSQN